MRVFASPSISSDDIVRVLGKLSEFVSDFTAVTFSCEVTASGEPPADFPLSSECHGVRPRAFTLGGKFPSPSWQTLADWDDWWEANPVWRGLPSEGGVSVRFRDRRFPKNGEGALWDISWQSSYRLGDYILLVSPLYSTAREERMLAATAWQAGAEILRLPIQATPVERGYLLELLDSEVVSIRPTKFPIVRDSIAFQVKPWLSKENFYRCVFELYEAGGRSDLQMTPQIEVAQMAEAEADDALEFWKKPDPDDVIEAWNSFQHWNSLTRKYYTLVAEPISVAGYRQIYYWNGNVPPDGPLFETTFGEDAFAFGVYREKEKYSVEGPKYGLYVASSKSLPFDLKALDEAMQMTFVERELFYAP